MMIQHPRKRTGSKELRIDLPLKHHFRLHEMKLLHGKRMAETVEEALALYFERLRIEHEADAGRFPAASGTDAAPLAATP